jgi:hypothetical protein
MRGQLSRSRSVLQGFEVRLLVSNAPTLRLLCLPYKSRTLVPSPFIFLSYAPTLYFLAPTLLFCQFLTFSTMPRGGNEDSDGLGDAHPAMWESKLSKADERRIRKECFIPPFVKIRFAERGSGDIVRSDHHEVCVYETMFRTGFRLPFLPMVRELLNYLDLSPHQVAPNAWRFLFGCMVLCPLTLGK